MKRKIALALALVGLLPTAPALADALRCGDALIEPGDDASTVLAKCGAPDATTMLNGPVVVRGRYGSRYSVDITRADRWRYDRKPGQFPATVIIGDDGHVASIEFDTVRQ